MWQLSPSCGSKFQNREKNSRTKKMSNNDPVETMSQRSLAASDNLSLAASSTTTSEINLEKYHRLAAEFAKLRTQFLVLKKGVIDEQSKSETLSESVKLKDQTLRRLQQEIDSLNFRNRQLSKRIGVLQDELDVRDAHTTQQKRSNHNRRSRSFRFNKSESSSPSSSSVASQKNSRSESLNDSKNDDSRNILVEELSFELKTKSEMNEDLRQSIAELQHQFQLKTKQFELELAEMRQQTDEQIKQKDTELSKLKSDKEKMLKTRNFECLISDNHRNELLANFETIDSREHFFSVDQSVPNCFSELDEQVISRFYDDFAKCQSVIEQFAQKFSEFIRALSTLHSNLGQKATMLLSLFKQNSNHIYFLDFIGDRSDSTAPSNLNQKAFISNNNFDDHQLPSIVNDSDNDPFVEFDQIDNRIGSHHSLSVMFILQKFCDFLKNTNYDTYLRSLDDAVNQYSICKIQQFQHLFSEDDDRTDPIMIIEQKITDSSIKVVQSMVDYLSYLNKLNLYIAVCLNMWCKQLMDYDPKKLVVIELVDESTQTKLAENEKRLRLREMNENLLHSIASSLGSIGQLCNNVQILINSKSLLKSSFSIVFNRLLQMIGALEKSFEETKRVFSSKIVLEHDLDVTIQPDLKSIDNCLLSSLVFLVKSITELRAILQTNYHFFVDKNFSQLNTEKNDEKIEKNGHLNNFYHNHISEANDQSTEAKLKFCQAKLLELEKDRERCSIEAQLSQLKLEREQKKNSELEAKLLQVSMNLAEPSQHIAAAAINITANQNQDPLPSSTSSDHHRGALSNNPSITSSSSRSLNNNNNFVELGSLSSLNVSFGGNGILHSPTQSLNVALEDLLLLTSSPVPVLQSSDLARNSVNNSNQTSSSTDQKQTIDFLKQNLKKLINALQLSNSHAAAYQNDYHSLRQRLAHATVQAKQADNRLSEENGRLARLQEEYRTSVENYESQLSAMSEHLATLNERLTTQSELIEVLTYQKTQQQQLEANNSNKKKSTTTTSNKGLFKR